MQEAQPEGHRFSLGIGVGSRDCFDSPQHSPPGSEAAGAEHSPERSVTGHVPSLKHSTVPEGATPIMTWTTMSREATRWPKRRDIATEYIGRTEQRFTVRRLGRSVSKSMATTLRLIDSPSGILTETDRRARFGPLGAKRNALPVRIQKNFELSCRELARRSPRLGVTRNFASCEGLTCDEFSECQTPTIRDPRDRAHTGPVDGEQQRNVAEHCNIGQHRRSRKCTERPQAQSRISLRLHGRLCDPRGCEGLPRFHSRR